MPKTTKKYKGGGWTNCPLRGAVKLATHGGSQIDRP